MIKTRANVCFSRNQIACGSKESDPPFPFPRGESRGGDGSPHADARSAPANTAGTARAVGSPRKRGFAPLAHPPTLLRGSRQPSKRRRVESGNYNLLCVLDQSHECVTETTTNDVLDTRKNFGWPPRRP